MKPIIGIIGGAGPAAATYLENQLVNLYLEQGAVLDADFPSVINLNYPVQGINEKGLFHQEQAIVDLNLRQKALASLQVKASIICCGSLHSVLNRIEQNPPILNWLSEGAHRFQKSGVRRVGIISSLSSNQDRLYDHYLQPLGIEVLHLDATLQEKANALILAGMSGNFYTENQNDLIQMVQFFKEKQCDGIWAACTDLMKLNNPDFEGVWINSQELMLDLMCQFYNEK